MRISKKNAGFTLLEIIITIVISGIILTSAMSTYGIFTNTSQKMDKAQRLEKQTHFALTRISDRVRSFSIGYNFYGLYDAGSTSNLLFLNDGTKIEFKDENIFMNDEPFFSQEFLVTAVSFDVSPSENPFSENLSSIDNYKQPKVLIKIGVESRKDKRIKNKIQTTISSRIYE